MRDKQKQMTAEQLFLYAMRMLGQGNAFISAPILRHLRTGPLPTFQLPQHPFKRRKIDRARMKPKRGGNYRQLQGERYRNPQLMAAQIAELEARAACVDHLAAVLRDVKGVLNTTEYAGHLRIAEKIDAALAAAEGKK